MKADKDIIATTEPASWFNFVETKFEIKLMRNR